MQALVPSSLVKTSILAALIVSASSALGQVCQPPEEPSNGYCCPKDGVFDKESGVCRRRTTTPVTDSIAASREPGAPASPGISVVPAVSCDGEACAGGSISVNGQRRPLGGNATLDFPIAGALARVDIQVPGYADITQSFPVTPNEIITVRATLKRLPNLRVQILGVPDDDVDANVYVRADEETLDSCWIDRTKGTPRECWLTVPVSKLDKVLQLEVVGNVNLSVSGVRLGPEVTTEIAVDVRKHSSTVWNWLGPALLTVVTAAVVTAGATSDDPTTSTTLLAVGGGLTALDLLLGGYGVGNVLSPGADATVTITDGRQVRSPFAVPATIASRGRSGALGFRVRPTGLSLRW